MELLTDRATPLSYVIADISPKAALLIIMKTGQVQEERICCIEKQQRVTSNSYLEAIIQPIPCVILKEIKELLQYWCDQGIHESDITNWANGPGPHLFPISYLFLLFLYWAHVFIWFLGYPPCIRDQVLPFGVGGKIKTQDLLHWGSVYWVNVKIL